jgi:hypothetical protein
MQNFGRKKYINMALCDLRFMNVKEELLPSQSFYKIKLNLQFSLFKYYNPVEEV